VQELVRELRELSPVILAKTSAVKLALTPADAPVEFTTRELDGALYVIAVNKSEKPQTVPFGGGELVDKRMQALYEKHEVKISGQVLADEFAPLGGHVYRIE